MSAGFVELITGVSVVPMGVGGVINGACRAGHRGLGSERPYLMLIVSGQIPVALRFCDRSEIVNFANLLAP